MVPAKKRAVPCAGPTWLIPRRIERAVHLRRETAATYLKAAGIPGTTSRRFGTRPSNTGHRGVHRPWTRKWFSGRDPNAGLNSVGERTGRVNCVASLQKSFLLAHKSNSGRNFSSRSSARKRRFLARAAPPAFLTRGWPWFYARCAGTETVWPNLGRSQSRALVR